MIALAELVERDDRPREDHFARLRGATWADYERVLEIRGEQSAPRITYLKGTLEIMSPWRAHDSIKSVIGRLVEAWCLEQGVEFSTCGSWTLKDEAEECAAEPDECYVFGEVADPRRPDLAIEVVWTRGGLNKLEVYRRLDVKEVWYWRRGRIQVYRLRGRRYEEAAESGALPGIDLEHLATFVDRPTTSRAIRDYRASLAACRT